MGSFTETLRLIVDMDVGGAVKNAEVYGAKVEREAERAKSGLDKVGLGMQKAGAGMITFGAVATAGLLSAGNSASDLNEVASKSATVFGQANEKVDEFATSAAKIGLSKTAALEAAGGFGNMFDQLGIASDKAADMSIQITGLASDFASFHNADITEVLAAQSAAFRGEYDSIQAFLPLLSAATVEQKAMALTGQENKDALTAQDKALAVYELMLDGAGAAQGDFERTSGSAANQQRILAAEFENVKASLGQGVLPVMQTGLGVINAAVGGFSDLNAVTSGTAGKLATFGAVGLIAVGGLSSVIGKVITMRENLSSAVDGVKGLGDKLGGLGKIGAIAGGVAGIAAVAYGLNQIAEARDAAEVEELADHFTHLGDTITEEAKKAIRAAHDLGELDDVFGKLLDSDPLAAENLIKLAEAAHISSDSIKEMREAVEQKRESDAKASVNQEEYSEQTREAADAMKEAVPAAKSLDEQLEDQAEAAKAAEEELKGLNDALDLIISGYLDVPKALADQNSKLIETAEHFKTMREEYGRGALSLDLGTEAGIKNREMLDGIVESTGGVIEAMRNTGASEEAVQLQWAASRGELQKVMDKFRAAGVDVSTYDALIAAIDRHVETNIRVTGVAASMGQLGEFRRQYSGHEYLVHVRNIFEGSRGGVGGLNIGGGVRVYHDGGIVPGPRGQEVAAILQAGEEILSIDDPKNSANASRPGSSGGGAYMGGATILNLNVDLRGAYLPRGDDFERAMANVIDSAAAKGYITQLAMA